MTRCMWWALDGLRVICTRVHCDLLGVCVGDTLQHSEEIVETQWQEKIQNEDRWERAGQEPVAKQILRRKWGGSDTPSGSQHPAPHAKPWPGTRRGRGREAGLATVGGDTLKQSWNSRGPTGPEWQEQPRTECNGGGSLMAYAPMGAMGISK